MDDGHGERLYALPGSLSTAMRRHFKALGWSKSGIKPLHGQRAGFVNRLWQTGVDLTTVQQALGHSNITVTQGYLPKDVGHVQAAVEALPGGEPAKIRAKTGNNRNK